MKKVAIVHDNLLEYGGSERVLEHLIAAYPEADLYTFFINKKNQQVTERFGHLPWRTALIQHIPVVTNLRQYFSLLKPLAWWHFSHLDLTNYEVVFSSSHSYNCKAVRTGDQTTHFSYVYTPPRFLYGYSHELSHLTRLPLAQWFLKVMQQKDREAAQRPQHLFVSSSEVQQRVHKHYGRDSVILNPPVPALQHSTFSTHTSMHTKTYYVAHSRLVRQKGIELVVQTCAKYHLPLVVIGEGYLRSELEKLSGPQTKLLGFVPDENLGSIYEHAIGLLYAAEDEDFGIVPVEAQSCGVPVIAYKSGGVQETVVEGETGYFFDTLTVQGLYKAIQKLKKHPLKSKDCIRQAARFQPKYFKKRLQKFVEQHRYLS